MTGWAALLLAGILEIGFTTFLKLSDGFTKWKYITGFLVCAIGSFTFLNRSLDKVPLGMAYAIWTGIGAAGTVLIGMAFFGESFSPVRLALLLTLVGSIIGLRFT